MFWMRKDFLGLEDLSKEELELVLSTAESFKDVSRRAIKKVPALRGKTVVNLFYEPSTRTRVSFEIAAKRLSADVINIMTETSSVKKGETLIDTGTNIQALKTDIIVVRHNCSGAAVMLARHVDISVVNAGDGWHEHPTQALLDILTLKEKLGRIDGLNVTIVGGVRATNDINQALEKADAVNVLRMQFERDEKSAFPSPVEYFKNYGITKERLENAKRNIIVMHPGPLNRGVEISSEVADGANSVILEQVTNGIAVRMAVLFLVSQAQDKKNETTD